MTASPTSCWCLREDNEANVLDNSDTAPGSPQFDTNPRILAAAFGRSGGGYDLAFANHDLIPRTTEPNVDDYLEGGGVTIKGGTLRVALHLFMSAGGWSAGKVAYTFRFQHGRFELIGYDSDMIQRNSGEDNGISVNYATGKMKLSAGRIDDDAVKVTWKTLPSRPLLTIDQIGDGMEFDPAKPPR
ncbi:MAG: hypothetical protein WDO24_29885 [Pseudomonadota bacterium]